MSYQQYFVAIATVIPVFFLANVVQFREFSDAQFKTWVLVVYGVVVLGASVAGEVTALQYVYGTGFPRYSTEQMPLPDGAMGTVQGVLLFIVIVLIVATLAPALAGGPRARPAADTGTIQPPEAESQPAGRVAMVVGLTALAVSALIVGAQRRTGKQ